MPLNVCSMCNGSGVSTNYTKQVDPPAQPYCTVLGDKPQQGDRRQRPVAKMPSVDVCVPTAENSKCNTVQKSSIIQVPCDPVKPCPQFVCEPCPPAPPTKIWLLKSSPFPQKSSCLPICGPFDQGSSSSGSCKPIMVCLPCQPLQNEPKKKEEEEEYKPIGLVTRYKEMDFIGGKMVYQCTCGRKNGLAGENCPRISCQNNPGCSMNPPRCWPQIKTPKKPPPPPPDQDMICVPIEIVYYDQPNSC